MVTKETLEKILTHGIAHDLFNAQEALNLVNVISEKSEEINGSGFGRFFGSIQGFLIKDFILYTCRMFDRPHSKYLVQSIPSFLKIFEQDFIALDPIQRHGFFEKAKRLGIFEKIQSLNGEEFNRYLIDFYRGEMDKICKSTHKGHGDILKNLKGYRDKEVAHNELVIGDRAYAEQWENVERLIEFAKDFLGTFSWIYFNVVFEDDNGYHSIDGDSAYSAQSLRNVLHGLGISQH